MGRCSTFLMECLHMITAPLVSAMATCPIVICTIGVLKGRCSTFLMECLHMITAPLVSAMATCPIVICTIGVLKGQCSTFLMLSHTWVQYPGFSGHGVKCPILTTVVPGFSGDLIGCTIRSKWAHLGICTLPAKIFFVCEISCFWLKWSFPKGELVLWSVYGDKLSICRNQQMNGKI